MFKISGPILVAATLDARATEPLLQADALARAYGVGFHACHVLPEIFAVQPLFPQLHLDDAIKLAQHEAYARAALAESVRSVTGRDLHQAALEIENGTPHTGILRAADRVGAGLVVVGADSDEHGAAVLGGIADRVVRHANCPVLVVRDPRPGKVLAATDFSEHALPAVDAGAAEAKRRRVELALVHVLDITPMEMPAPARQVDGILPPGVVGEIKETMRSQLREIAQRFDAQGGALLREGPAAPVILGAAEELPAQLLVLGTLGRTGWRRLAIGSVAEMVVRHAPCSVLVERRAG